MIAAAQRFACLLLLGFVLLSLAACETPHGSVAGGGNSDSGGGGRIKIGWPF